LFVAGVAINRNTHASHSKVRWHVMVDPTQVVLEQVGFPLPCFRGIYRGPTPIHNMV
jgi:hypothetical protein